MLAGWGPTKTPNLLTLRCDETADCDNTGNRFAVLEHCSTAVYSAVPALKLYSLTVTRNLSDPPCI